MSNNAEMVPVNYNQYSLYRNVNVIPETEFKQLVEDTFQTITETLRVTYGPFGRQIMISQLNDNISTKDGYRVFNALRFTNNYKHKVYLNIAAICERVNHMVGDGTTSCILLAEKMFNAVNNVIKTPNDKRNALKILNHIEYLLQNNELLSNDMNSGIVKPLTVDSMRKMLSMADNYDEELADMLMVAFDPILKSNQKEIDTVHDILAQEELDRDSKTNIQYKLETLPGMYRVRCECLNLTMSQAMSVWTTAKFALYDHMFTLSDWTELMEKRDKLDDTLIIIAARSFANVVMNESYAKYMRDRGVLGKKNSPLIFVSIKGNYVINEINDLAAVLGVKPYKIIADRPVVVDDMPTVTCKVHLGNCLCFDNVTAPTDYIEGLKKEMEIHVKKSYECKKDYLDRIRALSMESIGDKVLRLQGSNPLELKLISDKIDDCTNVIRSAIASGVVPNMLRYGYYRLNSIDSSTDIGIDDALSDKMLKAMSDSIEGLFMDVWRSKYGAEKDIEGLNVCAEFYDTTELKSYDIITESVVECEQFPTSAQYDIEVIVASISIVKFLLTSGAFIFDAQLLNQPLAVDAFPMNQPD